MFTESKAVEQMIPGAVARRGGMVMWLCEALLPSFGSDKLSAKNAELDRKDGL